MSGNVINFVNIFFVLFPQKTLLFYICIASFKGINVDRSEKIISQYKRLRANILPSNRNIKTIKTFEGFFLL